MDLLTKQTRKKNYPLHSVSRSLGNNIFLLPTDLPKEKNYRRKIHRRRISIGDFVGKLITDGICVLRRWKNSVGKTVKYCSDMSWTWVKL